MRPRTHLEAKLGRLDRRNVTARAWSFEPISSTVQHEYEADKKTTRRAGSEGRDAVSRIGDAKVR